MQYCLFSGVVTKWGWAGCEKPRISWCKWEHEAEGQLCSVLPVIRIYQMSSFAGLRVQQAPGIELPSQSFISEHIANVLVCPLLMITWCQGCVQWPSSALCAARLHEKYGRESMDACLNPLLCFVIFLSHMPDTLCCILRLAQLEATQARCTRSWLL